MDKYCYFFVSLGILLFLHEIFTCSSPPTDTMCYTCIYNYSNKLFLKNKILVYVIVLYTMTTRYSHNVGEYECRI
jgi:hypothetical protein